MPARSIGTGTLSFGMVSIPIRTYAAGESAAAVSFNLLHGKCKSRLQQQYVCPKDNEIVPRGQDKGGEKAYRLLNEAMKKTGRVALAKWAARGKQYLVMIRPVDKGLVMQ